MAEFLQIYQTSFFSKCNENGPNETHANTIILSNHGFTKCVQNIREDIFPETTTNNRRPEIHFETLI